MAYSYFDDDSPRFELRSLWFLVGVIVFAFSVLAMTALVTSGADNVYYLNVHQQPSEQTRPVNIRGPVVAENANNSAPATRYNR